MNDLGMLQWVHQGYAMENAHPQILAATDLRAPHHAEDGVARVIERLLSA
jgi:hydroxymethylpyrimidine pyrophosphatase-like HAD family hydrolase